MMKKKSLSLAMSTQWAQAAHAIYLDALMSVADWTAEQFVFHGGTSLHLSWNSARYSEDLDFLLSRDVTNMERVATKVLARVRERFRAIDPAFVIDIQDKSKDASRMVAFHLTVSQPAYMGKAMVKVEFWRTDARYLQNYPKEFRTPIVQGDMVGRVLNPVPAAALATAYADKLTAFATRPRLKWRDIYDLWWIGTQSRAVLDVGAVSQQFLHNVQAYSTVGGLPPADALRQFLNNDRQAIIARADPELKRWLPAPLWKSLYPDGIEQMVDYVYYALGTIAQHVDAPQANQAAKADLKQLAPAKQLAPTRA